MCTANMERKKILWLVSWYPNKTDRFDGDFIQRHARAAAIHHDIHVIFVKGTVGQETQTEECNSGCGLTEQIIYFSKREDKFAAVFNFLRWRSLYLKAVADYEKKNGRPAWVHVHVPWKAGLIALELKKRKGWEYFVTEHWGIYNMQVGDSFSVRPFFTRMAWRKIFAETKQLISVSSFLGRQMNEQVIKKPVVIIPNVVDTALFRSERDRYPTFTFIHVSNMVPLKNVEGIVEAFQSLVFSGCSNCRLVLIGDREGKYLTKYGKSELLNKQLIIKGEISNLQVAEEMRLSHCFILNSMIENAPCVVSEALCCGLPVIATKVGGLPEMLNAENGVLIKLGSGKKLVEAMQHMMLNYTNYNKNQIAKEAAARYGNMAVGDRFHELYCRLLGSTNVAGN